MKPSRKIITQANRVKKLQIKLAGANDDLLTLRSTALHEDYGPEGRGKDLSKIARDIIWTLSSLISDVADMQAKISEASLEESAMGYRRVVSKMKQRQNPAYYI